MKKHFRAIGDFWRVEYGRYVGMTAIAFLVLVVLGREIAGQHMLANLFRKRKQG